MSTIDESEEVAVYMLDNEETDQYYIGATTIRHDRIATHFRRLRNGTHVNKSLQTAYNENPNFVLKYVPLETAEEAFSAEKALIDNHRGDPRCLNIKGSVVRPPEVVAKIAAANTGKHHTEETKARLSEATREYFSNPEKRREHSERRKAWFQNGGVPYQLGLPMNPDTRKKLDEGFQRYLENRTEEEKAEHYDRVFSKIRMPVQVGDKIYPSIKDAGIGEGVSHTTARARTNSPNFPDWKFV